MNAATPREASVLETIRRHLRKLPRTWHMKTDGRGLPDLIGCHKGQAFAIEVKRPGGRPTRLQVLTLAEMAYAGARTGIATNWPEAAQIIGVTEGDA